MSDEDHTALRRQISSGQITQAVGDNVANVFGELLVISEVVDDAL